MTISEQSRHQLYRRLEEVLGADEAAVLMEHLPPVGWADVATKRDIDGLAAATKRDIDGLAAATKRDIEGLAAATKRDIEGLAAATKRDIDGLRQEMERQSERLSARLDRELRLQTWRFVTVTLAAMAAIGAGAHF